jgi:hypothetical protein
VSSGIPALDDAAVKFAAAGSGHYIPGTKGGVPIRFCGELRVVFKLQLPAFANRPSCERTEQEKATSVQPQETMVCTCIDSEYQRIGKPVVVISSGNARFDDGAIAMMVKRFSRERQGEPVRPIGCFNVRFKFEER